MTPEQHHLAVDLFEQLCDCGSNQQREFLKQIREEDDEVRRAVEAMLAADQHCAQFLEAPPDDLLAEAMANKELCPSIGQRFGDYEVLERLGTGGMCEVFLAQDSRLERKAALKFLSQDYSADPARLRRFEREARAVSALNHPNIVTVYGFGQVGGGYFIATEFIDGKNLREELSKRALAPEAVVDMAIQAASALAAAHGAGIVHRDIKPENIMVRADGLVKIVDFGLAKRAQLDTGSHAFVDRLTFQTVPGLIVGTPRYMSPEQARGLPTDARTDLFSLGSVMYEALTATPAVSGTNLGDILSALLSHDPPPLETIRPDCPAGLEHIVSRALEKDRDKRYQSAEEMLADLESIQEDLRAGKASPAQPRDSVKSRSGKRWRAWLIGAIIAVLSCVGVLTTTHWGRLQLLFRREPVPCRIQSLAVLPFQNMSGDAGQEYFADGVTEELITELAKISALRVISRTSVMRYRGEKKLLPEIARELKVDAVVEGTLLRAGDRVRITAQLIRAVPEKHLWSESYERDLRNILDLQREVARAIADEIKIKLTSRERTELSNTRSLDPVAHESYLRGIYLWNKRTEQDLQKSIEYFNQAVQRDPDYALAYAGLANAYNSLGVYAHLPPRKIYPKARAAALKALVLDDTLAEAHAALCFYASTYEWDQPGSDRECRRAIELNPGYALAHLWRGETLSTMQRHTEALAELDRALELDPTSLLVSDQRGWVLYMARRYDEAIEQLRKTIELEPRFAHAHCWLGKAYLQKGMFQQALSELEEAASLPGGNSPLFAPWLGYAYALSEKRAEAFEVINRMKAQQQKSFGSPFGIAVIYCGLGERDQALAWLEKAYDERDPQFSEVGIEPPLDPLRSDPQFRELLRRSTLPP